MFKYYDPKPAVNWELFHPIISFLSPAILLWRSEEIRTSARIQTCFNNFNFNSVIPINKLSKHALPNSSPCSTDYLTSHNAESRASKAVLGTQNAQWEVFGYLSMLCVPGVVSWMNTECWALLPTTFHQGTQSHTESTTVSKLNKHSHKTQRQSQQQGLHFQVIHYRKNWHMHFLCR